MVEYQGITYQIAHRPGVYPGDYSQSWTEMDLSNGRAIVGCAERTGVTQPGYPMHPVYRLRIGFEHKPDGWGYTDASYIPGYWVWDGQDLTEWEAWHVAYRTQYLAQRQAIAPIQAEMAL